MTPELLRVSKPNPQRSELVLKGLRSRLPAARLARALRMNTDRKSVRTVAEESMGQPLSPSLVRENATRLPTGLPVVIVVAASQPRCTCPFT